MIRRISKNNDLKDLIKSCPSGVIDDITEIRYFISGQPQTEIVADFEKVGNHLEAILPTSDLETLSNGVLMRRALYRVSDPAYPDGYYNLEFVDNLNVWLGEEETEDPFVPGYITEGDLKTLNGESLVGDGDIELLTESSLSGYATQSYVDSGLSNLRGDINSILNHDYVSYSYFYSELSSYATKSYVDSGLSSINNSIEYTLTTMYPSIGYMDSVLTSYADKMWVASELEYYASKSWVVSYYATKSWVSSQQFATESWVQSQGYITSETLPEDIATQSWVLDQGQIMGQTIADNLVSFLNEQNYAEKSWVVGLNYATESWVSSQQFITSVALSGYATESYVQEYANSVVLSFGSQLTEDLNTYYVSKASLKTVNGQNLVGIGDVTISVPSLDGYATESWVQSQGYITSTGLSGLATQSWVESYVSDHDFATAADVVALSSWVVSQNYATQSWVSSNFLSTTALTGYATESWVQEQGYLISHQDLSSYATQSWVTEQGYLTSVPSEYVTESWVSSQQFATQSWVSSQGYLISVPSEFATQSWVESQGYLSSVILDGYATQSWVQSQSYLSAIDISGKLNRSEVWTGTENDWELLTELEKQSYLIALIVE